MSATRETGGSPAASMHRHLRAGAALVLFLIGGVGAWSATTDIAGAVIAAGSLVSDSNSKKVQHPTGGIVRDLLVRDGDRVKANDVLVRLDDTVTRANLAIVSKGLDQMLARKARLDAERDASSTVVFPTGLRDREPDSDVSLIMDGERRLFDTRRDARLGQKDQLRQRIQQLKQEGGGYESQAHAKAREIVLIQRELDGARDLWKRNLMPISKLTALEREATQLEGDRGRLIATIAQVQGKVSETELQIIQIDRDFTSDVGKELRETDAKIGEFVERKIAAEDQLKRIEIRAPQDGMVHQLTVHTVGGVISAGEQIMLIVPLADTLIVEAKIAPQEIEQLHIGQTAVLRFSAFNRQTTPEIDGVLDRVSPDTTVDQRTGQSYYTARITVSAEEIARLGAVKLVPGMPVEAFVQTGDRKVLSYLIKPLRDQLARAFRES